MLNPLGNNVEFPGPDLDGTIPELNLQPSRKAQQQLVLVFVVMPDECSAQFSELQFLSIQLTNDPRFPVLGHLRQLLGKINFACHDFSFLQRAAVTQNPKTDTEGIRGKLGQESGTGDKDDAQEGSHGRA
ncbi:MAG: hypothetical protein WA412_00005, partial [Candidatus Sulfotelmatobacter sp.]